ncbi:hypothetical protein [Thomasclavelia sp.]|uniref:serine O-acetyltransferase n=1 Tax=Thomasclavelia sp. TaxID=3025757 RepID=UPI0025DB1AE8|nr:hypothetical protein [Thomasclavelia sp.]
MTLYNSIKNDRKLNSFKSFIILLFYRLMHNYYIKGANIRLLFFRIIKEICFIFLGINAQISYKAVIGNNIRLLHSGLGVVISSKALIYDNQTIYHQVTLGINENLPENKQKIIIEKNCLLSTGCKIISSRIGENTKIGPNAVVYKDLSPNTLYVSSNEKK